MGGTGPATYISVVESWDGSSWTEVADLATARYYAGGLGTSTLALLAGGVKTGAAGANDTEEWTKAAGAVTFTSS